MSDPKLKPERPGPAEPAREPVYANKRSDPDAVADTLVSGEYVIIEDTYPAGLAVLAELRKVIFGKNPSGWQKKGRGSVRKGKTGEKASGKSLSRDQPPGNNAGQNNASGIKPDPDFKSYRELRSEFHYASNRLLAPVMQNRLALHKAPEIGWLEKLYPDRGDFLLSFPQVQGLNSSWQWYLRGVRVPVLHENIHPWYGVYFPTRFDHLILFDKWLKRQAGSRQMAMDVGTGCGVLAFQMLNHGYEKILAGDISPNALISTEENARRMKLEHRLDLRLSDLFENTDGLFDLIVFNPPWLPAQNQLTGLDKAIYYEPDLFERFFSDAGKLLKSGGKIVILFSNLGLAAGVQRIHPVEEELRSRNRYKKVNCYRKKAARPSRKTRRRDHRENEFVELWELEVDWP